MRHRVERAMCPVCRNSHILKSICTACNGRGEAIILHKPGYEVEIHPLEDEARLLAEYPDEPTPVHERTTVQASYAGWKRMVELVHVTPAQDRVMKQAYYAGCWWMLEVLGIQMDPESDPTADDLEYMQRVSDELKKFAEAVRDGRA